MEDNEFNNAKVKMLTIKMVWFVSWGFVLQFAQGFCFVKHKLNLRLLECLDLDEGRSLSFTVFQIMVILQVNIPPNHSCSLEKQVLYHFYDISDVLFSHVDI